MASTHYKIKAHLVSKGKTEDEAEAILLDSSKVVIQEGTISTWNVSGITKPTSSELTTANTAGSKLETTNQVRKTRKRSYGDLGDQLDLLYKDMVAGKLDTTGTWATRIKAVKDANPKP